MAISSYSTTASSNTSLFPEGMAPSAVNDGMRTVQADIRSWYESAEWIDYGFTPTRTGNTTFTVSGDRTSTFVKGRAIKCTDSSTLYGMITDGSHSGGTTTVTVALLSGNLSASLTAVSVGALMPGNLSLPWGVGEKGTDKASAATVDLSTANGDYLDVTGTTTITALGTADAGVERAITFTGALTLTHNATSLILPGSANITTAAGDSAVFKSRGSGNWKCISYTKQDGTAVVAPTLNPFADSTAIIKGSADATKLLRFEVDGFTTGTTRVITPPDRDLDLGTFAWEKISSTTASSSSAVTFTDLSSTYRDYIVVWGNIAPATDGATLRLTTSANNGSSYDTGASDYQIANNNTHSTSNFPFSDTTEAFIATAAIGNAANESMSGWLRLHNPAASAYTIVSYQATWLEADGAITVGYGGGMRLSAAAVNAIRFAMSSGNIASGTFTLYGIRA